MDSAAYRQLIVHLFKQGKGPKEIWMELVAQYGQDVPSEGTVKYWVREFESGRTDLSTKPATGRPPEAITTAKIEAARLMVAKNPKLSTNMLASELNLAWPTVKTLMDGHLKLKKVSARWVPHTLSEGQKFARFSACGDFVSRWGHRWSRLRSRLITEDETWIEYEVPLTRQSAGEWQPEGAKAPELARIPIERRKSMAIVFWDDEGLVHLEWFKSTKNKRGIDAEYYAEILERFHAAARENRPDNRFRSFNPFKPMVIQTANRTQVITDRLSIK